MTAINPVGSSLNHHILSVLVQNRPGVLARVASLFARRRYNIFSLAVAPAEDEGMSRITVVVDVDSAPLEQIVKQLFKPLAVAGHQQGAQICEFGQILVQLPQQGLTVVGAHATHKPQTPHTHARRSRLLV